jgi:hypothetical protein
MAADNLLNDPVADLASRLEAMTDDEVFTAMSTLEAVSEGTEGADRDEALARIALIEVEIERRFPGQLLAPYRDWKKSERFL